MAREHVIEALHALFAELGSPLVCAYLFGSQARGEAGQGSDLDIAVLFRDAPPANLDRLGFDLAGELEREVGVSVDIVVLNRASPDLVHRVLRDGVLVHEGDRRMRVAFETRRRAEYFDVLPYLRQYRRSTAVQGT
jgi:predicted nucleotidyltransferase